MQEKIKRPTEGGVNYYSEPTPKHVGCKSLLYITNNVLT